MEKEPVIALYENDFDEAEGIKEETLKVVLFRLVKEWYGTEISKTREIIKVKKITYLPSSPEYIIGIINLRGTILSVTDLKKIFNLEQEEITEKSRFVVIENEIFRTGLLVDEVVEILEIPVSKINPTLLTIPAEKAEYFFGGCKVNGKLIGILNVEKILRAGGKKPETL